MDTGSHWSTFGELVILALIQIGGLGVMSVGTLLVMLIGRRLSAPANILTGAEARSLTNRTPGQVLVGVLRFTLAVEAVSAIVLSTRLRIAYHEGWGEAIYSGIFHSISAFNNAGFGLLPDSAVQWAQDPWMCVPLMVSVSAGPTAAGRSTRRSPSGARSCCG